MKTDPLLITRGVFGMSNSKKKLHISFNMINKTEIILYS